MLADELHSTFLLEGLNEFQIAQLIVVGTETPFVEGDVLFEEGEPAEFLFILIEGAVELFRHSGDELVLLMTMVTPGQWAGGLQAWGGAGSSAGYRATGRAAGEGRVFKVPSSELGRLVATWFPFGHHMISGIFQTVRNIEATARQRESLVALGRIAAGLAHELNNPAAAAVRSVDELRTVCDALLGSLGALALHGITAEQYTALDALRREVAPSEGPRDALAMADLEEAVGDWLDRHGVTDGWKIAPTLASVGIDVGWCDRVEALVGAEPISAAMRWAAATVSAALLLDEVEEATSRISNLVGAVKSYSQMDRTAKEPVDVRDGIQSTLVMLAHRLRGSVEVVTDYAEGLPLIDGYAGELNQVWTNLIDNAVDAMDGAGTLRISARRDGTDVVVDIADSGPGMPPGVMERVFEPFFTTKDVGRGTGLGLDISRRIVMTRHGGDISFDSRPGETIAHVRLPISH